MRKISRKVLIGFIAMLVLSATAFAALTFSLADETTDETDTSVYAAGAPSTIIDYIIENSISADSKDPTYHILELGSSDTPSDLQTLVTSDGFRNYVINGNKSSGYTSTMPDTASIEYIYYNATEGHLKKVNVDGSTTAVTDVSEIVNAIQKADLCYLSNDPSSNGANIFKKGNDIPEDVKIALSSYATGDKKPLIIDSHSLTQKYISNTSKTMETIATIDFANYGAGYSTYKWPESQTAGQFFDLTDMTALFLPVNGRTASAHWTLTNETDGSQKKVAKVLTIQVGDTDSSLTTKMMENLSPTCTTTDTSFDTTGAHDLNTDSQLYKAYVGRYGTPDIVKFETLDIGSGHEANLVDLADPSKYDLATYDFVVIEKGTRTVSFTGYEAAYNTLLSAMYSSVHVLYSMDLVAGDSSGSGSENTAANYKYVYDKVATSTDKARYDYILVCTRAKMSSYALATTGLGVKDIADAINAGSFRGINGNGSDDSSNVYTALEVEPCYPINTTLAAVFADKTKSGGTEVKNFTDPQSLWKGSYLTFAKNSMRDNWNFGGSTTQYGDGGFYYLRTDGVLDATSDEISYNGTTSLTDMYETGDYEGSLTNDNAGNIVDYYNWSLSKAKIAHALGVAYDEVRVVHMSSTEFAQSKDTLLDNYDMIYFGGDTSSVTSDSYLHANKNGNKFYRMYRHNGDTYNYPSDKNGYVANTTGVMMGNDITDDKLKELKEYVSKGMPVVFDKDLTAAYNDGRDIDPQSNIYDFFNFASGTTYTSNNALWNFDQTYTAKLANIGSDYGKTFSGYVTVFAKDSTDGYVDDKEDILGIKTVKRTTAETADDFLAANLKTRDDVACESQLAPLIQEHQRPRLAVTSMPLKYVEGNKGTWLESNELTFKYKINGNETGDAMLYIDDDSNGRFTEEDPHKPGSNGTVTYTLPKDYFGVVYWKLIVQGENGTSASTTGVCKVKRKDQEKMVVDLLEIIPPMEASENNKTTLLFCTECQQTRAILHGNRSSTVGKYSRDSVTGLSSGFKDTSNGIFREGSDSATFNQMVSKISADPYNKYDKNVNNTTVTDSQQSSINDYLAYSNVNNVLGVHEHKFGIVKYYENLTLAQRTGVDDWTTNWFDEIKDDYEVNLTMMTTREYEQVCALVNDIYNGKSEAEKEVIVNEFQERKAEYYTYWKVMRELINGHDDTSTYTTTTGTTKNYIQATDWAKFYSYMTNSTTDPTNKGLGFAATDITAYKNASQNIDTFLTSHTEFAGQIAGKGTTDLEQVNKEIAFETNSSIPRYERNYYDLFSLVNSADGGPYANYGEFSKLYQVWRNAKMLEIYFKNQYVKYSLLSSVNAKPTGNTVDSVEDNYIDLSSTFNCVVIGAAEDFNGDDINRTGCNALLDYINDEGNLILFHDTLTATQGNTAKMTTYLSDAFGQNARHQEYYSSDYEQIRNKLNVTFCGSTKTFDVEKDTTEVELKAVMGEAEDKTVRVTGHYINGGTDQTTSTITLSKNTTKADFFIVMDDQGNLKGTKFVATAPDQTGTHDIELTPYLCKGNVSDSAETLKANLWHGPWYKPDMSQAWATYAGNLHRVELLLNGVSVEMPLYLEGDSFKVSNASFTVTGPTVISSYGAGFDGNTQIDQKLSVKVEDASGNPVSSIPVTINNMSTGESVSATTASGVVEYTFSNMAAKAGSTTSVRAKSPYKSSEYFLSDTTPGKTPNTYTLTTRSAMRDQKDSGGNMVMPYKYSVLDKNSEDAEYYLHGDHDARDAIHSGVRAVTDKTVQVNKGIVTQYPFTIGSKMKVSNTTAQSYALDIENPNMTVYYTLDGGTSGTLSSMYAADPHNGVDNYFIYQYGAITYTGAGHGSITGLGRDNNDERRLFINIIVNSARKSTSGPDLKLYDVDSDMSKKDSAGNRTGLWNDYVMVNADGESDYKMYIEDITDQVDLSFLPSMSPGTTFDSVEIYFDIDREGSNKNVYNSGDDIPIFNSGKSENVDSDILTRITTGRGPSDPMNRIGINLDTPDPGLELDSTSTPNLVLKESYFDKAKKAYIVVTVYDNKGNSATKTLKVEYRPELLELN